jgi:hypothetical protein
MQECVMRNVSRIITLLSILQPLLAHAQATKTPVLVELFTSEGCSSCPPADRLLAELNARQPIHEADIVVLEEHVDYWDNLGWRDRFSSPLFTVRQTQYAARLNVSDPYTPQMVVDGKLQFVGNDSAKALAAVRTAIDTRKIALSLTSPVISTGKISAAVSTPDKAKLPHGDLYAALVEPAASTQVRAGENGGRTLNHVNVVRTLQRIGRLQDLADGPVAFTLSPPADIERRSARLVVFAQISGQGAIQGIATAYVTP